ncbi:hypothetical protein B4O95_17405, partial [Acinetobacter baumannii]
HLNNCATGVATQQDHLRQEHYIGEPQMLINFFHFIAEETRELMKAETQQYHRHNLKW